MIKTFFLQCILLVVHTVLAYPTVAEQTTSLAIDNGINQTADASFLSEDSTVSSPLTGNSTEDGEENQLIQAIFMVFKFDASPVQKERVS